MATNMPPEPARPSFFQSEIGIGPLHLPVYMWLIIGVVGVGAFFIVPKLLNKSSANTAAASDQASTDAGTANIGTLSSAGIDPFTGVPFSVEQSTNPGTGLPNYYNGQSFPAGTVGGPTTSGAATNQVVSPDVPATPPPPAPSLGQNPTPDGGTAGTLATAPSPGANQGTVSYAGNYNTQFGATGASIPSGYVYTSYGNPNIHLWNLAIQEYGLQGPAVNNATQAIIDANPSLAGQSYNYVPPAGTQIKIPQVNPTTGKAM